MKKILITIASIVLPAILLCLYVWQKKSPAAEDRSKMDANAKIMSDSIKKSIENSLNQVLQEVNAPGGATLTGVFPTPTPAAQPQNTVK